MFAALLLGALGGCREEPVIVIRFEPQDLAAPRPRAVEVAAPLDAARVADAGAAPRAANKEPAAAPPVKAISDDKEGSAGEESCSADADCVMVPGDCCGCTAGGTARAVAKAKRAAVERAMARRCGETACPTVMSTDPSCLKRAGCRQHRCVLVDRS